MTLNRISTVLIVLTLLGSSAYANSQSCADPNACMPNCGNPAGCCTSDCTPIGDCNFIGGSAEFCVQHDECFIRYDCNVWSWANPSSSCFWLCDVPAIGDFLFRPGWDYSSGQCAPGWEFDGAECRPGASFFSYDPFFGCDTYVYATCGADACYKNYYFSDACGE